MTTITAKQIAQGYARGTMPASEVGRMYELRKKEVAALATRDVITAADVFNLERTGRFQVATELFSKCNNEAQDFLLNDGHHFVRSAAAISASTLKV